MTTSSHRPNLNYPTCAICGYGHREPDEHGKIPCRDDRPSQCPECPSASPPAVVENRWECLSCGWFMYYA